MAESADLHRRRFLKSVAVASSAAVAAPRGVRAEARIRELTLAMTATIHG